MTTKELGDVIVEAGVPRAEPQLFVHDWETNREMFYIEEGCAYGVGDREVKYWIQDGYWYSRPGNSEPSFRQDGRAVNWWPRRPLPAFYLVSLDRRGARTAQKAADGMELIHPSLNR